MSNKYKYRCPSIIQIESSTVCNARCLFCPHSKMTREHGVMSDVIFHKIVKEGKEMGVKHFTPFLNGEPFLFPKIFEWLDYLKKERVETHLFTNASLLNKEKIDRLVVYKHIKFVYCSFHGATKETYQRVMGNLNFEKTKENIKYLIAKASFPVYASMVVFEENVHEKEEFKKMWGKYTNFTRLFNWGGNIKSKYERTGTRVPCERVMRYMTILWDGRVCLCCMDSDGEVILGNLNKQSLREIWENNQWLRDKHQNLDFDTKLCRSCNFNTK